MDRRSCSLRNRSGEQLRQVTSAVHKGRPCNPCLQGNFSKYVHPKSWKNDQLLAILRAYEPSLNIQPDSCICRLCRDDINKIVDENFIPRWKKRDQKKLCAVPKCANFSTKCTQMVNRSTLCTLLEIAETELDECEGFPLCSEHYGTLYRKIKPFNRNCKTCNSDDYEMDTICKTCNSDHYEMDTI